MAEHDLLERLLAGQERTNSLLAAIAGSLAPLAEDGERATPAVARLLANCAVSLDELALAASKGAPAPASALPFDDEEPPRGGKPGPSTPRRQRQHAAKHAASALSCPEHGKAMILTNSGKAHRCPVKLDADDPLANIWGGCVYFGREGDDGEPAYWQWTGENA